MAQKINLDALIPREDFEVADEGSQSQNTATFAIRDLEASAFAYHVLRKPDFQRETNEWDPAKACDFIRSFLDGDLIPAIILWHSGSNIFVIDGAHRLSALIAWVHDDYGDGRVSKTFFDGVIPDEQIVVAEAARRLVKRTIGSYEDHQFAITHPARAKPEVVARAKKLASVAVQLQWVKGDAETAEASFFKINQQAAPINSTELRLLKSRRRPNAVAARAIIRSGTGHKYWSQFPTEAATEIEAIAKHINTTLFAPTLRTPIKTLDLPVAGRGYSAQTLPLIFDFVNLANDVKTDESLENDTDGEATIRILKRCRKIVDRMSGVHPSSLGLHPAVYFYSDSGRYHPTSFLAMAGLIKRFEETNGYRRFTDLRENFEAFLLEYKVFAKQVVWKLGSGPKGAPRLQMLLDSILTLLEQGMPRAEVAESLAKKKEFAFLQPGEVDEEVAGRDFRTETKSAVFLREALAHPLRCKICCGLIHYNSISFDHIVRRQDGGLGTQDNAQLTHPYCNTTYKN